MIPIQSVLDVADDFDAFCIDMFGVVWTGTGFFDGTLDILTTLKQRGKRIYILSNSTVPRQQSIERYESHGLYPGVHYDDFLTSASILEEQVVFHQFFEKMAGKADYRFYVIGYRSPRLFQTITDRMVTDMARADFVYFGAPSTPEKAALDINHLLPEMDEALRLGLPAVLANPDYYAFRGQVRYCTQGLMGRWYRERGGSVVWVGKPYPLVYDYALAHIQKPAERCLMIGDTLRTDIMGGHTAGMKTLLITGTGMTADDLKSGRDLDTLCRDESVFPDYIIERFC